MSGCATCGCGPATCGCCEGVAALTPRTIFNRPGLPALSVRIGTHGSFLSTMKARLSTHVIDGKRPLAKLRVREDDPAIALLDSWATVGDVLTFYQERIVNEGYLRTASEMRSVHGLAALVGYTPRPGVGASVWLSYTLDEKSEGEVIIPKGSRVQSVPGPGELPQFFETSEDLPARAAWNGLGVRKTAPTRWVWQASSHELYLAGTATRLKPGDPLLVAIGEEPPEAYRILVVEEDAEAKWTRVELQRWDGAPLPPVPAIPQAIVDAGLRTAALHQHPPTGKIATEIVRLMGAVESPNPAGPLLDDDFEQFLTDLRALRRDIAEQVALADSNPRATKLRAWGAKLDKAIAALIAAIEDHLERDEPTCSIDGLVGKLSVPPAFPPRSADQLGGSLKDRFEEAGDAGLTMLAQSSRDLSDQLAAGLSGCRAEAERVPPISVWALRLRTHLFGHHAPKKTRTTTGDNIEIEEIGEWPIITRTVDTSQQIQFIKREARNRLDLDGSHEGVLPQSWLLVDMTGVPVFAGGNSLPGAAVSRIRPWQVRRVTSAQAGASRGDYGVTGEITRLFIETWGDFDGWIQIAPDNQLGSLQSQFFYDRDYQVVRGTTVYAASEQLALAESPIVDPVCDGSETGYPLELDGLYLGLEPGRYVMVSGERADIEHVEGVAGSEPAMIAAVVHDVRTNSEEVEPWSRARQRYAERPPAPAGFSNIENPHEQEPPEKLPGDTMHTFVWLEKPLAYCYRRSTLAIHGNLVKATHGESRDELLGNGDGAKANQSFTLKHAPLTWLPSPTPGGAEDTLDVYVNDIRWTKVSSFTDLPPTARAYAVRTDHKGVSSVLFGDGREAARLPSGVQNVRALYRNGIGRAGNALAGQISQLVSRPLGVKEVINPYRASGGADPESVDQARENAPLATAALGRLVATRDYADFARTFAGIAKADAIEVSDGRRSVVHVTIAGLDDIPIDPGSDLMAALHAAYRDLGDPFQPVVVDHRELLLMIVEAKVRIDPDRLWEPVVSEVREALFERFGFERRALGQGVAASEVINVIQSVAGVAMVDLDLFDAVPTATFGPDGPVPLTPEAIAKEMQGAVKRAAAAGVRPKVDARDEPVRRGRLRPAKLILLSRDVPATLVLNQLRGPA